MKNLQGKELKESIRKNIISAIEKRQNAATEIVFKFIVDPRSKYTEKITIFGGIYFRDLDFGSITPQVLDIIVNNFHYDCFALIESDYTKGSVECHGHGDYWGTDKFKFTYLRLPEEEDK